MELDGRTALVTGASSGLGEEFARQLAAGGANLIIVARREERLHKLAGELKERHRRDVTVLPMDLSLPDAGRRLHEQTEGAKRPVDVLINNAGFGTHEQFLDVPWEKTREQLQLNVVTVTESTWRFAHSMVPRKRGFILNVSSIGAFIPSPSYATYSAGKAYVRDFTEAIAFELRDTGVHVCALCPGITSTEFHQVAGHQLDAVAGVMTMEASVCVRLALEGLFDGRHLIIPGAANAAQMFTLRLLPRALLPRLADTFAGKRP